jgi:hypothetical protein
LSKLDLKKIGEFLPSFLWGALMLFPFVMQWYFVPANLVVQQGLMVFFAFFAFVVSDIFCYKINIDHDFSVVNDYDVRPWIFVFVIIVFVSFFIHINLAEKIPLFDFFMNKDGGGAVSREAFSKLLDVPIVFKYLLNWSLLVFAPLACVLLVFRKNYFCSIIVFVVCAFYSILATAKTPLIFFVIMFFMAFSYVYPRARSRVLVSALVLFAVFFFVLVIGLFNGGASLFSENDGNEINAIESIGGLASDDPRKVFSLGDRYRVVTKFQEDQRGFFKKKSEYIFYRVFLTPSDVSCRWYQYFSNIKSPLGLSSVFKSDPENAPSRSVGLWAYRDRFPDKYLYSINAYASIDSDGFARGGVIGAIFAILILVFFRVAARLLLVNNPLSLGAYGVVLGLISVLSASASVQAILFAQGLLPTMFILLYLKIKNIDFFSVSE